MWYQNSILKLFLLVLLLLCFSFSAYSQEQADITIDELTQILTENESLKNDYMELMQKYQEALQAHKAELMKLQQTVKLLEVESEVRSQSLTELKNETAWTNAGWFITGLFAGAWTDGLIKDLTAP